MPITHKVRNLCFFVFFICIPVVLWYVLNMTRVQAVKKAAEMIIESTNIIIQKSDDKDIMVFKFHKLDFPNVKISLALNGIVEKESVMKLDEAFLLLVDAIELSS
jgi:hypothetical protein